MVIALIILTILLVLSTVFVIINMALDTENDALILISGESFTAIGIALIVLSIIYTIKEYI